MIRALIFFVVIFLTQALVSEPLNHTLKEGETLYSLSRQYGVGLEVLMRHNSIADPKHLKTGTVLRIPQVYRVKKGDTLYSIAQTNGITLDLLLKTNGLKPGSVLTVNQSLILPGKNGSTPLKIPLEPRETFLLPLHSQSKQTGDAFSSVGFFEKGVPFTASAPGVVIYKNQYKGLGLLLLIQGKNSHVFGYSGFQSTTKNVGDAVKLGEVLGVTSRETEYTLKYFIFNHETPIDPLTQKPR